MPPISFLERNEKYENLRNLKNKRFYNWGWMCYNDEEYNILGVVRLILKTHRIIDNKTVIEVDYGTIYY